MLALWRAMAPTFAAPQERKGRDPTIPYSPIDVFAPQGMVADGGLWHASVTPTVVPPRLGSRGHTIQSRRQRQHSEKFDRLPPFGLWRDCPKGVVAVLAWISTDRNWPHKTPSRMPIFRVLSHRCCDAKGCRSPFWDAHRWAACSLASALVAPVTVSPSASLV